MAIRTDPHRPGLFVPANYTLLVSYVFGHAFMPPINVDRARAFMAMHPLFKHPTWGFSLGKCSVCGAHFNYGDVWLHAPSGELVTVGHDCADKYDLMADRSAFELEVGNFKAARAVEIAKAEKAEQQTAFFDAHPGLEAAFVCTHPIVQDIKQRFEKWGDVSPKQIELVLKLAGEAANPTLKETMVPAPEGRVTFVGEVQSVKTAYGEFGLQTKVTVKMVTPLGAWLAWGTCPAAIVHEVERGSVVEFTATLKHGRDNYFALMSRPKGRVIPIGNAI